MKESSFGADYWFAKTFLLNSSLRRASRASEARYGSLARSPPIFLGPTFHKLSLHTNIVWVQCPPAQMERHIRRMYHLKYSTSLPQSNSNLLHVLPNALPKAKLSTFQEEHRRGSQGNPVIYTFAALMALSRKYWYLQKLANILQLR